MPTMFASPSIVKFEFLNPQFVNQIEFEIFDVPLQWRLLRRDHDGTYQPVYTDDNQFIEGSILGSKPVLDLLLSGSDPDSAVNLGVVRTHRKVRFRVLQTTELVLEVQRDWHAGGFPASTTFPLGLRNVRFQYSVHNRRDLPKNLGQDALVSLNLVHPLGYAERYEGYNHSPENAVLDNNAMWMSEPQPVSESVVALYHDIRGADESATVVDGLYLSPVTPGVTLNIYHSSDDSEELVGIPLTSFRQNEMATNAEPVFQQSLEIDSQYWRWGRKVPTPKGLLFDTNGQFMDFGFLELQDFDMLSKGWMTGIIVSSLLGSQDNSAPTRRCYWSVDNGLTDPNHVQLSLVYDKSAGQFQLLSVKDSVETIHTSVIASFQPYNQFALVAGFIPDGPHAGFYLYKSDIRSEMYDLGWVNDNRINSSAPWSSGRVGNRTGTPDETAQAAISFWFVRDHNFSLNVAQFYSSDFEKFFQMTGEESPLRADAWSPWFARLIEDTKVNFNIGRQRMDSKKWSLVLANYRCHEGELLFPQPIHAKYLKLEFTNLQGRPYTSTTFEVEYEVFPRELYDWFKWNQRSGVDVVNTDATIFYDPTDINLLSPSPRGSFRTEALAKVPLQFLEEKVHKYDSRSARLKDNTAYFAGIHYFYPLRRKYGSPGSYKRVIDALLHPTTLEQCTFDFINGGGLRVNSGGGFFETPKVQTNIHFQTVQLATVQSDWLTRHTDDQLFFRDTSHISEASNSSRLEPYTGGEIDPLGSVLQSVSRRKTGIYDEPLPHDEPESYDDQDTTSLISGEYGLKTSLSEFVSSSFDYVDGYVEMPGETSNLMRVNSFPEIEFSGPLTLIVDCAPAEVEPIDEHRTLIAKWRGDTDQRSWMLRLVQTTGALTFFWSEDGNNVLSAVSTETLNDAGYIDGQRLLIAVVFVPDNMNDERVVRFRISDDQGVTWNDLGTPVVQAGATSIHIDNEELWLGGNINTLSVQLFDGQYYGATVIADAGGFDELTFGETTVFELKSHDVPVDDDVVDLESFTSTSGQQVFVHRSAGSPKLVLVPTTITDLSGTYDGGGGSGLYDNGLNTDGGSGVADDMLSYSQDTGSHVNPSLSIETTNPKEGTAYQQVRVEFDSAPVGGSRLGLQRQVGDDSDQTIAEDDDVSVDVWLRGFLEDDTTANVELVIYDSSDAEVGSTSEQLVTLDDTGWEQVTLNIVAPANAFYFAIFIYLEKTDGSAAESILDIDDLRIYEGAYGDAHDAFNPYDGIPNYRIRLSAAARVFLPQSAVGTYELRIRDADDNILIRRQYKLPYRTWVEIDVPLITDLVDKRFYAELVQVEEGIGETFVVAMLALFYSPFVWEISNDNGHVWMVVAEGINNPYSFITLPKPGTELKVRCTAGPFVGAIVSGYAVIPWYLSGVGEIRSSILADNSREEEDSGEGPLFGPWFKGWSKNLPQHLSLERAPQLRPS